MAFLIALVLLAAAPEAAPRGRDLGIPFDFGPPGPHNAITDVPGVEVGHVTLIEGDSVRTGVTAVLPRGKGEASRDLCFGGFFSLNGNGEMTGTEWLEESGLLEGPVMITNTNSVGVVRDAVIGYAARRAATRTSGRCPWWRRHGTGTSTTSTGCTSRRSTRCGPSTARPAGPWPRATSAAARGWCATSSRAGSGPRPARCRRRRAG